MDRKGEKKGKAHRQKHCCMSFGMPGDTYQLLQTYPCTQEKFLSLRLPRLVFQDAQDNRAFHE